MKPPIILERNERHMPGTTTPTKPKDKVVAQDSNYAKYDPLQDAIRAAKAAGTWFTEE